MDPGFRRGDVRNMITLSNGHSFEFVAASGALAFDGRGWPWEWPLRWVGLLKPGLFTIVTKSLTLEPRRGNLRWFAPFRCVRQLRGGAVNAVGLTNPGIDWWIKKVYPAVEKSGWNFVVSIAGESLQDYMEMTIRLKNLRAGSGTTGRDTTGCDSVIKAIEINASCPNSPGELQQNTQAVIDTAQALKYISPFPLILKLSCTHEYLKIAKALEGTVEAISINSVPWAQIFPDKKSPLARFGGGGVSGKMAQPQNWKMAAELAQNTKIPVIGASVWNYNDLTDLFGFGAKAIAFGSIFLSAPWRPTLFVQRWRREADQRAADQKNRQPA